MNYVQGLVDQFKYLYSSVNPIDLSGAIDVVVVEQPDGTLVSTPFHVRFGNIFSHENKLVYIEINGREVESLHMRRGEDGVVYFEGNGTPPPPLSSSTETLVFGGDGGESGAIQPPNRRGFGDKLSDESPSLSDAEAPSPLRRSRSLPELSLFESTATRFQHKRAAAVSPRKHLSQNKMQPVDNIAAADEGFSDSDIESCRRASDENGDDWEWGERKKQKRHKKEKKQQPKTDLTPQYPSSAPAKYPTTTSTAAGDRTRHGSGDSQLSTTSTLVGGSDLMASDDGGPRDERPLRPSSDQLKQLGLEYGQNEARFSITTQYEWTQWCSCSVYLYRWNEKLVISDIDGTITKSDFLGHLIPPLGGTWAQPDVAQLFTKIAANGYRVVYLSSRPIAQASSTKTYLKSIIQGSKTLPDGPLLLSPYSVFKAVRMELIERRPDEFKIACLSELKALFPGQQPFAAGFGNRETDVKSYLAMDIPPHRIFLIDDKGVVKRADRGIRDILTSYAMMARDTFDFTFPFLGKDFEEESRTYAVWPRCMDYSISTEEMQRYEQSRREGPAADAGKQAAAAKRTSWYGGR